MQLSQSTHRQSFIDILANDIRQTVNDESLSFHTAATRVLLEWLGYNLEDVNFIDGYDRGVDAWLTTESGIDIFQFKTHEPNTIGTPDLSLFNGEGIRDLERAKILLLQERASNVSNKKLKRLLHEWDSAIRNHRLENSPIAMSITLNLIVLGDNLTEAAQAEFQSFQLSNSSTQFVDDIPVQFHSVFHTVNDIIDARWREENRSWTDLKGRKHERITLHPWNEGDSISDNANAVFYCLAIDLVNTNEFMKKRSLKKPWAIGVSENQGLFEFIKACVLGYL
jgi:hypothetical protein